MLFGKPFNQIYSYKKAKSMPGCLSSPYEVQARKPFQNGLSCSALSVVDLDEIGQTSSNNFPANS